MPDSGATRLLLADGQLTLVCSGELDLALRAELEQARREVLGLLDRSLVVDLGRVTLLDCASARVVLGLLDESRRRDVRTTLVCPDGPVLRVLHLVAGPVADPVAGRVAGARLLRTRLAPGRSRSAS